MGAVVFLGALFFGGFTVRRITRDIQRAPDDLAQFREGSCAGQVSES